MDFKVSGINIPNDGQQVVDFWASNFPEWHQEKYHWFYQDNPAGEASCWKVNLDGDNKMFGTVALFPRVIQTAKGKLSAGVVGDFALAEKKRTFWPAFMLQKKVLSSAKEKQVDFIYGLPNEYADQLMIRAGYISVGLCGRYAKKIRSNSYFRERVKSGFFARILSLVADTVLFLISSETYMSVFTRNGDCKIETEIDSRFDQLWEKASAKYALIGERNSRFLNWRFGQCPYIEYKIYSLTDPKTGDLRGYVVYHINDGELCISDIFMLDVDKYFDHLMTRFLKHARKLKINTVVFCFFGNRKLLGKFRKFNFIERKEKRHFLIHADKNTIEKYNLSDPDNWYFMECDNDT